MSLKNFSPLMIFLLLALSILYSYQIKIGSENFLYTDFGKFYQTTRFFLTGKNIYTKIYVRKITDSPQKKPDIKKAAADLNPPFFTLLLSPLGLLSYGNAYIVWCIFSIGCGILSVYLVHKAMRFPTEYSTILCLGLLLFVYYPTFATIQFGQVALFLLPFLAGGWLAAKQSRLRLAGILLGMAASLKIIFGLFLLYFLMRREWRGLFWFILTAVFCTFIPMLIFGLDTYLNYYTILKHVSWYASTWNASLLGFFLRLFGGQELNVPLFSASWLSYKLYFLCSTILLAALIKYLWPAPKLADPIKIDLDFSIVIVTLLLISPLGWLYYFSWLAIPFLVCWRLIEQHPHATTLRILTAVAITFSGIAHELKSSGKITHENVLSLFIFSSYYVVTLLILVIVLYSLRFRKMTYVSTVPATDLRTLIYVPALLTSLFSILTLINTGALFGKHMVLTYTLFSLGT